jgi:hypothetical protein
MNRKRKAWKAKSMAWSGDVFVMPNETQVLLTNTNVIHKCTWSLSMRCANTDNIVYIPSVSPYIKRIKFEKTQRSRYCISRDVARKKPNQSTSKEVQSRINPKSAEKRAKIRWQMNKLFETEIVTHWWPPSWKLICIVHWKLSLRRVNANSISRRRKKQEKTDI